MKQLVVLSGKGGTGKTCVASSIAHLASREIGVGIVDADVDASNMELLLSPVLRESGEFWSGLEFEIDATACTGCGRCLEVCRFDAVLPSRSKGRSDDRPVYRIDGNACEGCGACAHECPEGAIEGTPALTGSTYRSDTDQGPLFHARLRAGAENSGKLTSTLRKQARERLASLEERTDLIIIDGPPGIGCPVISASTGVDMALLVTEPGASALHDLDRALQTCRHFGIEPLVVINKSDLNQSNAQRIRDHCDRSGVRVAGVGIPFDPTVVEAVSRGTLPLLLDASSPACVAIEDVWSELRERLFATRGGD